MKAATQTLISLILFVTISTSLVVLHIFSIFFFEVNLSAAPAIIVLIMLQCWLFVGVFITAHDAMHGSFAPGNNFLNNTVGAGLLFAYAGFGWKRLKSAHLMHHAAPGTDKDPDFNADNPSAIWPWYFGFMREYFGLVSFVYVSALVALYAFGLGASMLNIILFYAIPSIGSSLQLFYFGTYLPHRHSGSAFADTHNARSNDYPTWLSLLTCYHFGYHHEHHLFPSEPWWRLPVKRRQIEEIKPGI